MSAAIPLPVAVATPRSVLTGPGGTWEIPRAHRDEFALTDDHVLLVVHGAGLEQNVMAFKDTLKRKGVNFREVPCSLEDLRRAYDATAVAARDSGEITKASPERQNQVKEIFRAGVNLYASDIHFIGNRATNLCHVKFRVHGLLEDYEPTRGHPYVVDEKHIGSQLRSAVYLGMTDVAQATFKPNLPQDARMAEEHVKDLGLYGARVATAPLDKGQLMVCRLLSHSHNDLTMEQLGYLPEQVAIQDEMAENKRGIMIVAGETGAGKSTTLALSMKMTIEAHQGRIHVLTLEDPPEYYISGANQYPIINGDWPGAIKNAMRLDPDVMMIQEMRDLASAKAAFQAALTGHGVRTTLHANGPFSILNRLGELGLDKWLYTDHGLVRGFMHQGLVPTLCDCKIPWADLDKCDWLKVNKSTRERIDQMTSGDGVYLNNPEGCGRPKCHKGHNGRRVVARVVKATAAMLKVYTKDGAPAANEHWIKEEGGITHAEHLRRVIDMGRVDPLIGEHMICKLTDTYD